MPPADAPELVTLPLFSLSMTESTWREFALQSRWSPATPSSAAGSGRAAAVRHIGLVDAAGHASVGLLLADDAASGVALGRNRRHVPAPRHLRRGEADNAAGNAGRRGDGALVRAALDARLATGHGVVRGAGDAAAVCGRCGDGRVVRAAVDGAAGSQPAGDAAVATLRLHRSPCRGVGRGGSADHEAHGGPRKFARRHADGQVFERETLHRCAVDEAEQAERIVGRGGLGQGQPRNGGAVAVERALEGLSVRISAAGTCARSDGRPFLARQVVGGSRQLDVLAFVRFAFVHAVAERS